MFVYSYSCAENTYGVTDVLYTITRMPVLHPDISVTVGGMVEIGGYLILRKQCKCIIVEAVTAPRNSCVRERERERVYKESEPS
jgi:hypothetical protein